MTKRFIMLQSSIDNSVLGVFDITNVEVEIKEYFFYYFKGYENFILYLLSSGAIREDFVNLEGQEVIVERVHEL